MAKRRFFYLILLLAACIRWIVFEFNLGGAFIQDAYLDCCVWPWHFARGTTPSHFRLVGNNDLAYLLSLLIQRLAPLEGVFFTAAAVTLFVGLTALAYELLRRRYRQSDRETVLKSFSWMVVLISLYFPLVLHTVYTTAIAWCAGLSPLCLALLVLTAEGAGWAVAIGVATGFSVFLYPGFALSQLAIVGGWLARPRPKRGPSSLRLGGAYLLAALAAFIAMKALFAVIDPRAAPWNQYAGGVLSFGHFPEALTISLRDVFWRSSSWNAFNADVPYLPYFFLPFLVIGAQKRNPLLVSLAVALVLSLVASSLTWPYPGVRRMIWIFPFFFFVVAMTKQGLEKSPARGAFQQLWIAACVLTAGLSVWTSSEIGRFPNLEDRWREATSLIRPNLDGKTRVLVVSNVGDQFWGNDIACRLDALLSREGRPLKVRVAEQDELKRSRESGTSLWLVDRRVDWAHPGSRPLQSSTQFDLFAGSD